MGKTYGYKVGVQGTHIAEIYVGNLKNPAANYIISYIHIMGLNINKVFWTNPSRSVNLLFMHLLASLLFEV